MKQLIFMSIITMMGAVGAVIHPFWGILLYYGFAVLRPQALWAWALPEGIRWSLMAALATMVGIALGIPRLALKGQWNGLATLVVIFFILVMFSAMSAIDPVLSSQWQTEYAKIFIMALLAMILIDKLRYVSYLTGMIMVCIGYIAWEMNVAYIFKNQMNVMHRGYGGFDNNGAALMIAMGIPFCYAVAQNSKARWIKAGGILVGLFMVHAVLMSFSRGAMLSACLGVGWLLMNHRPRIHAGFIALMLCLAIGIMTGPEVRERFSSISTYESDSSADSRIRSWSAAWQMAWDHPWTGMGIRNSNQFGQNYGSDFRGRTTHNQYLQIAADNGIPAMLIYISICIWAIVRLNRVRLMTGHGRSGKLDDTSHHFMCITHDQKIAAISLAIQSSLLIYMFGSLFLSLEVFELSWLLIVLAGVLPNLVEMEYGSLEKQLQKIALEDEVTTKTHNDKPETESIIRPWPSRPEIST